MPTQAESDDHARRRTQPRNLDSQDAFWVLGATVRDAGRRLWSAEGEEPLHFCHGPVKGRGQIPHPPEEPSAAVFIKCAWTAWV